MKTICMDKPWGLHGKPRVVHGQAIGRVDCWSTAFRSERAETALRAIVD